MAAVTRGIPGVTRFAPIGHNQDIDTTTQPEDIWSGADLGILNGIDHRIIQIPNGAVSMEVVSNSADDTAAGTGARTVTITYIDANWLSKTVTLALNGLTPVALPETTRGINTFIVATVGTFFDSNHGDISIRATGGMGATYSYMRAGVGLAKSSLVIVPDSTSFDHWSSLVSVNRTDTNSRWADVVNLIMSESGRLVKGLPFSVSSDVPYRHEVPDMPLNTIAARSYTWLRCEAVSQSNVNLSGAIFGYFRPTASPV